MHRSPHHNCFSGPANIIAVPQSFQWAGESHRRAAIISAGRQISSPRRNHFSGPAYPIAAPQSFQRAVNPIAALQSFLRAGESHCRAIIFSAGRRTPLPRHNFSTGRHIPSPCHNLFLRPANLIAMLQSYQRACKPNRYRGPAHFRSLSRQTSSQPAHHRRACCITAFQSKKPHYH